MPKSMEYFVHPGHNPFYKKLGICKLREHQNSLTGSLVIGRKKFKNENQAEKRYLSSDRLADVLAKGGGWG